MRGQFLRVPYNHLIKKLNICNIQLSESEKYDIRLILSMYSLLRVSLYYTQVYSDKTCCMGFNEMNLEIVSSQYTSMLKCSIRGKSEGKIRFFYFLPLKFNLRGIEFNTHLILFPIFIIKKLLGKKNHKK